MNEGKILKLSLFGLVVFVLAIGSWMFGELLITPMFSQLSWRTDYNKAVELQEKDPEEAKRLILKIIPIAKKDNAKEIAIADMYSCLGSAYASMHDWKNAKQAFDQAISIAENTKHYSALADYYHDLSWAEHCLYRDNHALKPEIDSQKKALEAAYKVEKDKNMEVYLWRLGNLYIDRGELDQAEDSFNKAMAILGKKKENPNAYGLNCYARLYAAQHRWDESLETFLKAHDLAKQENDTRSVDLDYFRMALIDANPDKNKTNFSQVQSLLEAKDYDKLDQIAQQLRTSQEILPNGEWRLDKFYEDLFYVQHSESDQEWQSYLNELLSWAKHSPKSPTPRIALVQAYTYYAWKVRGKEEWYGVPFKKWEHMQEQLRKADEQLDELANLPTKCPRMYMILAALAMQQRGRIEEYDEIIDKCREEFPAYLTLVMGKNYYLLPSEYGRYGEWEKRVELLANEKDGADGDVFYAQMIWNIDDLWLFDSIFEHNKKLNWLRAKNGMKELIKRYPQDSTVRGELLRMALQANDLTTAKEAFNNLE